MLDIVENTIGFLGKPVAGIHDRLAQAGRKYTAFMVLYFWFNVLSTLALILIFTASIIISTI